MTDVNIEDDRGREIPVVNPLDLPTGSYDRKQLFLMWAGAYDSTQGYVWADHLEDAFEEWVEYLDDHAPGVLVSHAEFMELLDEAARERGFKSWQEADKGLNQDSPRRLEIVEEAEADLTIIGHTTLKNGMYIAGHEWGGDEVDGPEFDKVWNACAEAWNEAYDEWPEPPSGVKLPGGKGTKITDLDGVQRPQRALQQLPRWARPPRR